ncbi:MAG: PhoH family protein [Nanoarchaeota archaeon]|nr:PhoH family protein [Nanoarchaeota archaeon]MBU1270294.1 PhoH family protein [Nanoarchaeota archaeon]MBU1604538.1 PhoH family protein [Nanoarchaeota archaeon]MBU2442873.1 PhoH family protein [Nanoarchaeota archaeon]
MKKQYFVADTNIFLLDAKEAIHSFAPKKEGVENHLIIPYIVLEEMDKFKDEDYTSRGENSRKFSYELKKIISESKKSISESIEISKNYFIRVEYNYDGSLERKLKSQHDSKNNDNIILSIADTLKNNGDGYVELVTNDTNLYLKGSSVGLSVSDWEAVKSVKKYDDLYKGWRELVVKEEIIDFLIDGKHALPIEELELENLPRPNEYFILKSRGEYKLPSFRFEVPNTREFMIGKYHKDISGLENGGIIKVPLRAGNDSGILGIKSRDYEQSMALDALLRPDIKLVSLIGPAGTGKTLLSIAAGLHQLNTHGSKKGEDLYETVLIARPNIPMGKDIGYLPGDTIKKMAPWIQPIFDNITRSMSEHLIRKINKSPSGRRELESMSPSELKDYLIDNDILQIQPLAHIRGRSLENMILIVDEAQNLDPLEAKTIITRAGEGTKIIMTGDPQQIDKKGLTEVTNGLCYASEKMKDERITATMFMEIGQRSELATIASKNL